jgi:hypothetical protein
MPRFQALGLAGNYVFERPPRQALGAKLLHDRRTRPQAWFKTARCDPNLLALD